MILWTFKCWVGINQKLTWIALSSHRSWRPAMMVHDEHPGVGSSISGEWQQGRPSAAPAPPPPSGLHQQVEPKEDSLLHNKVHEKGGVGNDSTSETPGPNCLGLYQALLLKTRSWGFWFFSFNFYPTLSRAVYNKTITAINNQYKLLYKTSTI